MKKWLQVTSVSSAIGRAMLLILFMASLISLVAMITLFYSVPDAKAINNRCYSLLPLGQNSQTFTA